MEKISDNIKHKHFSRSSDNALKRKSIYAYVEKSMYLDFNVMPNQSRTEKVDDSGLISYLTVEDEKGRTVLTRIHPQGEIKMHKMADRESITYILSGEGICICNGKQELLFSGYCHICKKSSEHSFINTGNRDLVMLSVVVNK